MVYERLIRCRLPADAELGKDRTENILDIDPPDDPPSMSESRF